MFAERKGCDWEMAFLKPGTVSGGAFGVSFDIDKDSHADQDHVLLFNKHVELGMKDQRSKLPIASHR